MNKFKHFSEKQKLILTWWTQKKYKNLYCIICDGAIRSGKTMCLSLSFIFWALFNFNNQVFAICGKTIESIKRNIINQLVENLNSLGFLCNNKMSKNFIDISFANSTNRFYFFGGNDEKSASLIQGITLAGVLFDEVAIMPQSFVEQALARCSISNSKYFFNCNPKNPFHWFYKEWIQKTKEKNALYIHMTMKDNPSLSEDIIKRYEKLYSGVFYDRFIKGIWTQTYGQVYPMFSPEKHVVKTLPKNFSRYVISCDYGILNPTSFGLWGEHNNIWYRIKEYYYNSKIYGIRHTDEEYYNELNKLAGKLPINVVLVDPSAASFIECINKHKKFKVAKAINDVLKGINLVSDALNNKLILFHESCENSIKEFYLYRWDDSKNFDSVKKENDHAMDDIRYFVTFIQNYKKNMFCVLSSSRNF